MKEEVPELPFDLKRLKLYRWNKKAPKRKKKIQVYKLQKNPITVLKFWKKKKEIN